MFNWTAGRPDEPGKYLVTFSDGRVDALLHYLPWSVALRPAGYRYVIAYMPLPEPYVPTLVEPQPNAAFEWKDVGNHCFFVEILPAVRDAVMTEANKFGHLSDAFCIISRLYDAGAVMQYLTDFANREWEKLRRNEPS